MRALRAQARQELMLSLRNGESLLLTLIIPVLVLVFFAQVDVLPIDGEPIAFLAPGVLALAVLSTGMVNLAIATGFERQYGVLKRLGTTPLGRPRLLTAKTLAVIAVLAIQAVVLVAVALVLGWEPRLGGTPAAVGGAALATVAFAGIGLWMAGSLPALVTLAAANGLYIVLLLLGGMVIPTEELPTALRTVSEGLPSTALAEILHGALTNGETIPTRSWIVLAIWAVITPAAAVRWFRWE